MPHSTAGDEPRRTRRWVVSTQSLAVIILVLVVAAGVPLLFGVNSDTYGIPSNRPAPDFQLRDAEGQPLALEDFRGRYVYLMFGYLNCPNICHTQALTFEQLATISEQREDLAFVYIAIDPLRDDPEMVARYFDDRGERFISLHGASERALQALAGDYRVFFSRQGDLNSSVYDIDHTALFFLIDPAGNLRYTYASSQTFTPRIIADLERLEVL